MIVRYILTAFMLAAMCPQLRAMSTEDNPTLLIKNRPVGETIKILISDNCEGALIEVKGPCNVYDPYTGKKLESVFLHSSYYMYPTKDGLKWGAEFPGIYQLLIVPDSPKTSLLVHGIEYKGMLLAYQVEDTIAFVNEVSLDEYAKSLVADKCKKQERLSKDAFAALAIACRTDAYYKSQHGKSRFWHVKSGDVGYRGSAVITQNIVFQEAFQATAGMVLDTVKQIEWFAKPENELPFQKLIHEAEDKKDPRAVLACFFNDSPIVLAGR